MTKKTAEQRLQELKELEAQLKKQARGEDSRKDRKVGEFVREFLPHIEKSPEFLAWLKTDIDKQLFGVPLEDSIKAPIQTKIKAPIKSVERPVIKPTIKQVALRKDDEPLFRAYQSTETKRTTAVEEFYHRAAQITQKVTGQSLADQIRQNMREKV